MEHDGEAGQALGDLFQNVETQGRGNQNALFIAGALLGLELISAVRGADGDGQRVAAGLGNELLDLLGAGVGSLVSGDLHIVLDAGQSAQLGLDHNAVIVGILHDLLGDLDVLGKGLAGSIDHDGGEAAVNAALAGLEVRAVVQMQNDGDIGAALHSGLYQLHQIGVVGIGAGALGNLQDHGSVLLLASLGDALHDLHIVDVERADGIAAIIGFLEHFSRSNQWHTNILL